MVSVSVMANADDLTAYLNYLYEGLEGYCYVAIKEPGGSFKQHFYEWPVEAVKIQRAIQEHAVDKDVYICPAILDKPNSEKTSFKASNVVWVDMDDVTPAMKAGIPEPTMKVSSSKTREHLYWKLSTPITDYKEIERLNHRLQAVCNGDPSGWDATQVLRPPLTKNHKPERAEDERHVKLKLITDFSGYVLTEFGIVPDIPEPPEVNITNIPPIAEVILAYSFPEAMRTLYLQQQCPDRKRSDNLISLAYYCAEIGMSDEEIFAIIYNADERWKKFYYRDDREHQLMRMISVVRIKYPGYDENADLEVFNAREFLATKINVSWLIEGLVEEQGYMCLSGPSGVGKTQFTLRVAMALAMGKDWMGYKIPAAKKVAFFSLEMGLAHLKRFVEQMVADCTEDEMDLLAANFYLIPHGESLYLDKEDGTDRKKFERVLVNVEPDLVVIDSTGSTTVGELGAEAPVKSIMGYNDHIRKRYRCTTWWIHHMRKAQGDNKKPNKMADVYGNQYLVNRATDVICLWPSSNGIEVIPLKDRLHELPQPWLMSRMPGLDFMRQSANITMKSNPPVEELTFKPTEDKDVPPMEKIDEPKDKELKGKM